MSWYQEEKRNLPWRADLDPYHIWISEIMLQQTRVETVISYFLRFMTEFPSIQVLAAAPEEKLLKVWEGLGYYSRARNLQAAAKQVVSEYNGKMPETLKELRRLKGIGPYTAGAIASIAFHLPEPAIDGNVMRVVSRLFCIEEDIGKSGSRKVFDEAVRKIISITAPGDFNQAMMDLGSGICRPKNPDCPVCPIRGCCLAFAEDRVEDFPVKEKKLKQRDIYLIAGIIENESGAFLLRQKGDKGLLANMWTFPLEEVSQQTYEALKERWEYHESHQLELLPAAEDDVPDIFSSLPIVWQKRHFSEVTHVFTHLKWHILPFYGRETGAISLSEKEKWVRVEEFSAFVFPKVQYKMIDSWQENRKMKNNPSKH